MLGINITHRRRFLGALSTALLALSSGSAARAADSASSSVPAEADDACFTPALGFLAGGELHVGYDVRAKSIGPDRMSLTPDATPPEDAFVPFETHPDWGRVAIAVIVSAPEDEPEYLPIRHGASGEASLSVPALTDYFAIYIEKSAPAGSEFADYLFHSSQGVSAGYHLVHAEAEYHWGSDEPSYVFTVVDMAQPIPNDFQRGVVPTGLNL